MTAQSGLVVADFSRVLAAPYATMLLADLGADVIKVEHPGHRLVGVGDRADSALPEALQEANPWRLPRRVDGVVG